MPIDHNRSLLPMLAMLALLSGCTSTPPASAEIRTNCSEWRGIGSPGNSQRTRVINNKCETARPQTQGR